MKPKRFDIEPYKDALYLFCPCTKAEAQAWLKRKKIDQHVDLDGYDGFDAVTFYTNCGSMVFMHDFQDTPKGLGVLVHELVHVTMSTLNAKGVKEAEGTEEAAAYLLDSLFQKCLKHLRDQKAKQALPSVSSVPEVASLHAGSSGCRTAGSSPERG